MKRQMSQVRNGLRDRPERKPPIMEYYYAALNYTDPLENNNDNILVKIQLHGGKNSVTINAMIDSEATEDLIDREDCNKHVITMINAKKPREVYLADGKPSTMGPVTHMTKVPMDSSSHRELATLQVANLQNDKVILGMPWLREHNPTIDWNDKRITCNSERSPTWCLKSSPVSYTVPEEKAMEENLITRFSKVQPKEGPTASDQSVRVKKLSTEARVPKKRSARSTGHDLYANEGTLSLPEGKQFLGRESYWITSQHLWTNCTTKESRCGTPTHDKCSSDGLPLYRRSEGGLSQPRRPSLPTGKRRPDCITDCRKNEPQGIAKSNPVGPYQNRG